jgi:CheY-like chemotaxis protein
MVKLLSELHHGTVAVESAVGQGSCFRVWLPIRVPVASSSLPARASGPRQPAPSIDGTASIVSNSSTVLVIEDNAANLMFVTFLLESAGHTVLAASDAEAGLTLARDRQPELILMDIQLPGMDGLEATALLKRDMATRDIPVVALTAFAMKGDEERFLAAGFDGYIAKPMRYKDFLREIAMRLGPS